MELPSSRKPTFVVCDSASVRFTSEPAVSIDSDAVFPCSARSSEILYRPHVSGTASLPRIKDYEHETYCLRLIRYFAANPASYQLYMF
jgi:hypothetical protein